MSAKVNIDGKIYDVRTGRLVGDVVKKSTPAPKSHYAKNAHRAVKLSNAASRATYNKPVVVAKQAPRIDCVLPSAAIAPNPVVTAKPEKATAPDHEPEHRKKLLQGFIITIIVVIGFGLLAFFYFPSLSVNFAATQAGITGATYPSYTVDGYNMDGAVQTDNGKITINYRNGNGDIYAVSEQNSTWDSEGVLENYIKIEKLGYQVLTQQGLTIYRLDDGAIWVNGGILYTISDGRQLSDNQVLGIVDGI